MNVERRPLPSLDVAMPLSYPSPRSSPSYMAQAFPLEISPANYHRLPPLESLVQRPRQFDAWTPPGASYRAEFDNVPMTKPSVSRFQFPVLPSLRDTLRMTPELMAQQHTSPTKHVVGVKLCGVVGCEKRAKAGGVCIAHGGGIRCSKEGCSKHAVSLGFCISHGGGKRCTAEGCQNASRKFGVCWSHGGKRMCLVQGCTKGPKTGGDCWAHGGKMPKK
ncbi:hypothetical protein AeRB84_016881 [Aphanomyces euteiches]|nr:hypothetical protein AeRB84_016881 [Aphanomyces euteiches]